MNSVKRSFLAIAALLLVAVPIFAQNLGSLTGTVTLDGAPLPGATVTVSSPALQGTRTAYTDINGNYNFGVLPPGEYRVVFDMESMQTVSNSARVTLGGSSRANAVMRLSALAEAITVTASAPAVLETQEVQTNLQAKLIEDLPIGRTVQATITLAPGVTTNGPGGALVVGGGYAYDTLYVINGAVTNENVRGQTDNLFIEDAIQETTILTGAISAEYGRFTGGVVSAITKGGGNDFHGTFRDSFDDPSWDNTTDAGEAQQKSVLNETYEATLGGRIIRDRLWFFGAGRQAETVASSAFFINGGALPTPVARDPTVTKDDRFEGKLTGQITPKHSLVGSYLSYKVNQTPHCAFGCWDINTVDVDGRDLPRDMKTANYNGILSNNFIVEAGYSSRSLEFQGSGGNHVTKDFNNPRDLALGTWAYDYSGGFGNGAWGAPIFCGVCDVESRTNEAYNLKGTYYLATAGTGTHNLVAGYENFSESRFANNYQSGSNFDVYVFQTSPEYEANGTFRPILNAGDLLQWVPIAVLSKGSDWVTSSIYLNDKWDLSSKWSFNLGARYDVNDGKDSAGKLISDDSNLSPRLGLTYDIFGNGRFRANASYSKYVSRIQETIGGAAGGGNPSYFLYYYDGPQIGGVGSGLDSFGVLEELFKWFLANGGTGSTAKLSGVTIPGLNTRFDGHLKSPNVDEFTIGLGAQIGSRGFVRADYIDKTWNDFYTISNSPGDQIENPIVAGEFLDFKVTGNTDIIVKEYKAVQTQASYRVFNRVNLGLSYTWSEATGNEIGETAGGGPGASTPLSYREYKAFAQNNPVGFLPNDQTHRARIWASYDQALGFLGNLNISVLQRFDSGTPYSAAANVNVSSFITNPGYATRPRSATYFFSDRGEFRTEDVTATDLALNWNLPISKINIFVQGELINAFDEQALTGPGAGITAFNAADENRFNPFTTPRSALKECPQGTATATCVAGGFHWRKNATFGKATGAGSYQLPFTYRFSAGIRF